MPPPRWLDGPAQGGFTREVVSHFLFLARRLLGPLTLQSRQRTRFPEPGRSERAMRGQSARRQPFRCSLTGSPSAPRTADDSNSFTVTNADGAIRLRDWAFAERLAGDGDVGG